MYTHTYCSDITNFFKVNLEYEGCGFLFIYIQPNSSQVQLNIPFPAKIQKQFESA